MTNYKRLNDLEREEISRMLAQKCSFSDIARALGRHLSTISREINAGGGNKYAYRAITAQNRARRNSSKRKAGKHKLSDNHELWAYIRKKLREKKWSPRQIAEELKKRLSFRYGYAHIAGGDLHIYLCTAAGSS